MLYNFDELSFQILTIDRFLHKEGIFHVVERPYAALSFRVKGTGHFKIGGKTLFTRPGDVLFIPADVPYEVEYSVSESIVANLQFCNYTEPELFSFQREGEGALLFLQLLTDWQANHSVNGAKSTLYAILEKIDRELKISAEDTAFATCLQYIEAHFCDPSLDIGSVCEKGFISPSSLQRAFLQRFGVSPKQYIIKLRMNKALQLLIENKHSVKEISFLCGFSDEKYFSRAFREKYGYPPSQLRNHIVI
ncbi:MAG: helix-turn-helix domain-containing protein [Ruminococcaceae bacterium]|nr:helix-turn-helix domain-containing protein [Oscillospiraceae bacterium]